MMSEGERGKARGCNKELDQQEKPANGGGRGRYLLALASIAFLAASFVAFRRRDSSAFSFCVVSS
jgi:hypothetical protein